MSKRYTRGRIVAIGNIDVSCQQMEATQYDPDIVEEIVAFCDSESLKIMEHVFNGKWITYVKHYLTTWLRSDVKIIESIMLDLYPWDVKMFKHHDTTSEVIFEEGVIVINRDNFKTCIQDNDTYRKFIFTCLLLRELIRGGEDEN